MKMKVSTYALSALIVLAAAVPFTTAHAEQMKNACGSSSHATKNACGSSSHSTKNACGSSKHAMKNACGS